MSDFSCPHCGAPGPTQFPPGMSMLTCAYCKQNFPAPQPNMPPQQQYSQPPQAPQIVIMHTHSSYDDTSYQVARSLNWGYWMFRAGVPLVVFVIFGVMSLFFSLAGKSKMASSLIWDGTQPFTCDGNGEYTVSGVTANFSAGTAIDVGGNCHFTCTDCNIKAPQAIDVDGNGSVTILNGTIVGTDVLVDARENARVNISGNVTASGQVKQSSNAHVNAPKQAPVAAGGGGGAAGGGGKTASPPASGTSGAPTTVAGGAPKPGGAGGTAGAKPGGLPGAPTTGKKH